MKYFADSSKVQKVFKIFDCQYREFGRNEREIVVKTEGFGTSEIRCRLDLNLFEILKIFGIRKILEIYHKNPDFQIRKISKIQKIFKFREILRDPLKSEKSRTPRSERCINVLVSPD